MTEVIILFDGMSNIITERLQQTNFKTSSNSIKINQSHYKPEVPRGFRKVKVPRLPDNGPGWWQGCQPYAVTTFYPQEILLVLISVRG